LFSSSTISTFSSEKSTFALPSFDTAYHSPAYLSDGLQAVNNKNIPSKITICLNVIRIPTSFQSYLIFNTATLTGSPLIKMSISPEERNQTHHKTVYSVKVIE